VTEPVEFSNGGVEEGVHLFALSARGPQALAELARRYRSYLERSDVDLAGLCANLARRRTHHRDRLAFVAASRDEVIAELDKWLLRYGDSSSRDDRPIGPKQVFVFSGQGSQWAGMGRELVEEPVFRSTLTACDSALRAISDWSLLEELEAPEEASRLRYTEVAQPAICAVQLGLAALWRNWGVEPDLVVGHSVGEVAAAHVCGALSLEEAMRIAWERGRAMEGGRGGGRMAAVGLSWKQAEIELQEFGGRLVVAAENGPRLVVVSGESEALTTWLTELNRQGVLARDLGVEYAFHSPLMEPFCPEVSARLSGLRPRAPDIVMISTVSGREATIADFDGGYWAQNVRSPVRFAQAIKHCLEQGAGRFLELGPQPVLGSALRQCLESHPQSALICGSLRRGTNARRSLLSTLSALYETGHPVRWDTVYPNAGAHIDLPGYAWQRRRYWRAATGTAEAPRTLVRDEPEDPQRQASDAEMAESFHEIVWKPCSRFAQGLPRPLPAYLPPTDELLRRVQPETEWLRRQLDVPRYQMLETELDRLCVAHVRIALDELGGRPFVPPAIIDATMAERLGVVERHWQLLQRLVEMVAEEEISPAAGDREDTTHTFREDPDEILVRMGREFPDCASVWQLVDRCGRGLADVLRGRQDPLTLLFPSDGAASAAKVYTGSPLARSLNSILEEVIAQSLAGRPPSQPLRILEIGAGTGAVTAELLPRLPGDCTEYVFTDVSETFLRAAEANLGAWPFVRYSLLDIERDNEVQGFASHQFDVVIAANVLHATRNLRQSIDNVHRLLAPGGLLVLLEGTRPQRWLDLTFGLTDGWWRFDDHDLRPDYPLLAADRWVKLLEKQRFLDAAAVTSNDTAGSGRLPQDVIVARTDGTAMPAPVPNPPASNRRLSDQPSDGAWLILGDRGGIGERLADALHAAGQTSVLCVAASAFKILDGGRVEVDPSQPEHLRRALRNAGNGNEPAWRGIVHLWSLNGPGVDDFDENTLRESVQLGVTTIPQLVRELQSLGGMENARIWLVTSGAQPVTTGDLPGVAQSAVWGLGRVLAEELPAFWGALIDLDPEQEASDAASLLVEELLKPDGEQQVGYRDSQRYAARLGRRPVVPVRAFRVRHAATYLITGGLGDLGLKAAEWLAEQGAGQLVLFSRGGFPPRASWETAAQNDPRRARQIEAIRRIESLGASVHLAAADVADRDAVAALLAESLAAGAPPVRGVVHCAGVAEPAPLPALEAEQLERLCRAKVTGTWVLHELLRNQRLDFFVSFSTGAALIGSPLLGGYAAANAFADSFVHHRRYLGLPGLAVNWGFWDEVGMVARSQRDLGRGFASQGMRSFSVPQGFAALRTLLEADSVQAAVMPVNWHDWRRFHPQAARSRLLRDLLRQAPVEPGSSEGTALNLSVLLAAPAERRSHLLEDDLRARLAAVLRTAASELDVHRPLGALGVDSLMALELGNQVQASLGVSVSMADVLQDATIHALAARILELAAQQPQQAVVSADADQASPIATNLSLARALNNSQPIAARVESPDAPGSGDLNYVVDVESAEDALQKLDDFSDEQVDALLQQMLGAHMPRNNDPP